MAIRIIQVQIEGLFIKKQPCYTGKFVILLYIMYIICNIIKLF